MLLAGTAGTLYYHGAFQEVVITEETHGPYRFVFQPQVSVTSQSVGQITDEIDAMLAGIGVEKRRPMAIYFPDGSAQVGLSIEDVELSLMLSNGTATRTVPESEYMSALFPWKSPLSFLVGYYKVDPVMQAYRLKKGYPGAEAMTVYEGDHILHLQRIKREP